MTALTIGGAGVALAVDAAATQAPTRPLGHRPTPSLEVAGSVSVRAARILESQSPAAGRAALARFEVEAGKSWEARWDGSTGAVASLFGPGIAAPGVAASSTVAEGFARSFLARHIDLFAPGAAVEDFRLVADDLDGRLRTVAFAQSVSGLEVVDAAIGLVFEGDRLVLILSTAVPRAEVARPRLVVGAAVARAAAEAWVREGGARTARASDVQPVSVLPLLGRAGVLEQRAVRRVTVEANQPIGRFWVYLDAATGARVARRQTLRFAQGTVKFDAPVRHPGAARAEFPASGVSFTVDGAATVSAEDGSVTWQKDVPAEVVARAEGPLVRVQNSAGPDATASFSLSLGGSVTWSAPDDEYLDAQLAAYIHTLHVKKYVGNIAPELAWLGGQALVNVNIDDACNAYSDGDSTNFFRASGGCENTGRLADVVFHEFGHSVHYHAIIQGVGGFEEGLSEGIADYLASTMTGDSGMGRGMFGDDEPLREIDPPSYEYRWPDDVGESHDTGRIISGALWDLRKALVAKLGADAGVAVTDRLWYEGIRRAVDIPTMYPALLVADDDDGDLSNGTPNVCEIDAAFGVHGLRSVDVVSPTLSVEPPSAAGYLVTLAPKGLIASCPAEAVLQSRLLWRLRSKPEVTGELLMAQADDGTLSASIPSQLPGEVVEYQVRVSLGDGSLLTFPENPADPWYELFVGDVVPLYCNDFEVNPFANGWSHGVRSGAKANDDWQWGVLGKAHGSGDPLVAFSGKKVIGNDLGANGADGLYKPETTSYVRSPVVDTKGYANVRLQYRRWLTVEDGHFDHATIYANGQAAWTNFDSDQGDGSRTHHQDKEWRFHDVDLTSLVVDGKVQVELELASDQGLHLGGWNVDDFCVVAYDPPPPPPGCGDGRLDPGEACDDGAQNSDAAADACRTTCRAPRCGDGVKDSGEACDDGNAIDGDGCDPACTLSLARPAPSAALPPSPPAEPEVVSLDRTTGGCGCRQASSAPRPSGLALAALGVAAAWASRRRARRHA